MFTSRALNICLRHVNLCQESAFNDSRLRLFELRSTIYPPFVLPETAVVCSRVSMCTLAIPCFKMFTVQVICSLFCCLKTLDEYLLIISDSYCVYEW